MRIFYFILFSAILFLFACRKDKTAPILFIQPDHFPAPHYQFENFDLSQEKIDLGKALFYDPILSTDNTISCASCHHQEAGFSDPGKAFSFGVNDSLSQRNSMPLVNLAWSPSFFSDGGVNHLEVTSFAPITNTLEMNENMSSIVMKIASASDYKELFLMAYEDDTVTAQRVLWSLAAYMATLVSHESKYDKVYLGQEAYNDLDQTGYDLFQRDCRSCHAEPLTSNYTYENNGIDAAYADHGRKIITMDPSDHGKFKVPSLRNISETYPYMHDGRFHSLSEVIEHYSSGIKASSTLSNKLPVGGFNYTSDEKEALIAFLKTLSDDHFLHHADY